MGRVKEWSKGSRELVSEVLSVFASAHTHQACGCPRPQLPASSGAEPSLPALKLGRKRTSKPSDTDLSLLGLKSLLRLHRRKVSSPAKGTWEPLWAPHRPKSELRTASREGPRRTTRGLGFSSGVWVPETQVDARLGPPKAPGKGRLVGGNHSILKTLVDGRWEF